MTYLLVAMLLLLAGYAGWLQRRTSILAEDLRYVHKSTRAANESTARALAELRAEIAELKRSAAAPVESAGSWFSPAMTIQDALNVHPGVKEVLASLHIGGCSSCSVSSKESLEQAAAGHGVDLKVMLQKMNALMATPPAPKRDDLPPTDGGRVLIASGVVPGK